MNVSVPAAARHQRILAGVSCKTVFMTTSITLAVAGCSSISPSLSLSDLRIAPNLPAFENQFYVGASFGASALSPDTSEAPLFSSEDTSAGASQIRFGYDLHNRVALEFDSSILGEAQVDQGIGTSIKYTAMQASALFYALNSHSNRNRRERWNGYGRLGVARNRTASNISAFDGSGTALTLGAGVEYGMKNGLGIRGEITRFDAESFFAGLGIVYRFDSVERFIPENLATKPESKLKVSSRYAVVEDDTEYHNQASVASQQVFTGSSGVAVQQVVGTVTVLASASDFDVDSVPNDQDKCENTAAGTAVDDDGCGLFDGVLGNSAFSNGSAGLNANVKSSLDNLSTRLKSFPEVRIAIEGHTDGKGPEDINLNVSHSRANMVRAYLVRKGVPERQLETHAYGETKPVADNESEQGRDQNRRIAFVTLPSMSRAEMSSVANPKAIAKVKLGEEFRDYAIASKGIEGEPALGAANEGIDLLPPTVSIPGLNLRLVMENVVFVSGTDQLQPKSSATIAQIARVLQQHPGNSVLLAAHTNALDTPAQNLELSERQSRAVAQALIAHGVDRRRLVTQGYGNTLPLQQEVSERNRAVNRRIELRPLKN